MRAPALLAALAVVLACNAAAAAEVINLTRADRQTLRANAYPPQGSVCRGVAIISPGAGGSERGYRYLGEAMSALGYQAVVVGHQESGLSALRERVRGNGLRNGLAEMVTDPAAYQARMLDIAAARQWAAEHCAGTEAILLGHSMGAATTLIEAGARNRVGVTGATSFKAYIALSPQGAGSIFPPEAWSGIRQPVFLITGTRDAGLEGGWQTRTEPFANLPAGCKWLAVIDGATHMNFAGNGGATRVEALTTELIAAFLDGVRAGRCTAPPARAGVEIKTG